MEEVILQQQKWWMVVLFLLLAAVAAAGGASPPPLSPISKPGCNDTCGDESVPYPFGIGEPACSKTEKFHLNCSYDNQSSNGGGGGDDRGKKGRLSIGDFEMTNLSVETATATTHIQMSSDCYTSRGRSSKSIVAFRVDSTGPFTFSSKQNKFTVLGCDTTAMMKDGFGKRFAGGCLSACYSSVNLTDEDDGGSCSGIGCCRSNIPKGFTYLKVSLDTVFTYVKDFSPCSFAFLANQDWSGFTTINLTDTLNITHRAPVVLDWVVGNQTCKSFQNNPNISSSYACGANTDCQDSYNGRGYICSCQNGYQGNPYLPQGCQDVDECTDPEKHNCEGTCENTVGSFRCHCALGMYVDAKGACKGFRLSTLVVVVGVCLSLAVMIFFLWMECKRSNKARNFRKNGGTLLKHQNIKIFKEEELKKATRNYDHSHFLGRGGSGSVYKGELQDKELVAIKIPNVDPDRARGRIRSREKMNHEFQHEIGMVCSVNHKNVVKLKGLCLETNVPLLVYEFVPNGSLYRHIHIAHSPMLNSWKNRLRIACETAVALEYLHFTARTTPIIHGDVKSMNILLDENFTTKVADFGASVLIPLKHNIISTTKVQGTRGYLDPEYLSTGNLTVKSDVYSFGVVLMELLTFQKPISEERSCQKVNYITHFILSVEKGNHGEVLDYRGLEDKEDEKKLQVNAVAELAVSCLNRSVDARPDMAEVVQRLLTMNARNSGVRVDQYDNIIEEKESLQQDHYSHSVDRNDHIPMLSCSSDTETQYMTAFDGIQQNPSS